MGTVQLVVFLSSNIILVNNGTDTTGVWGGTYALTPGTYTDSFGSTLVVTAVATPEPSSLPLMLSGVGLVFGMRKRWGLSQAS